MKRIYIWAILAFVLLGGALYWALDRNAKQRAEIERLEDNQSTLLGDVEYYRAENGRMVASVSALTMRRDEFEELLKAERRKVEALNIRIKELESFSELNTELDFEFEAPIIKPDTIYLSADTLHIPEPIMGKFDWSDPWVSVRGELHPESVKAQINITDTITIVAHRKSRGWWIFRCKGKITHYDAVSANPHTRINHIKYVEVRD